MLGRFFTGSLKSVCFIQRLLCVSVIWLIAAFALSDLFHCSWPFPVAGWYGNPVSEHSSFQLDWSFLWPGSTSCALLSAWGAETSRSPKILLAPPPSPQPRLRANQQSAAAPACSRQTLWWAQCMLGRQWRTSTHWRSSVWRWWQRSSCLWGCGVVALWPFGTWIESGNSLAACTEERLPD